MSQCSYLVKKFNNMVGRFALINVLIAIGRATSGNNFQISDHGKVDVRKAPGVRKNDEKD